MCRKEDWKLSCEIIRLHGLAPFSKKSCYTSGDSSLILLDQVVLIEILTVIAKVTEANHCHSCRTWAPNTLTVTLVDSACMADITVVRFRFHGVSFS